MHIPDGFLEVKTWVGTGAVSLGVLMYAIKKSKNSLNDRQVPALGVMAAFIFAAQMINFPVAPGASGHLLGAALATILLGPWNAGIIISSVLLIQRLFFQDGGLTALGANIFNMAVVGTFAALCVYRLITAINSSKAGKIAASFAAAWFSVVTASLAAGLELVMSGIGTLNSLIPVILGWHMLIGIGEGIITAVVVSIVSAYGANRFNEEGEGKNYYEETTAG
ncbi:energy-coupling factor ABC transporter permease [Desulfolucanica intricata]|uniref:energy-coupling factor ABC transporter permease n=1 Tax=Desulfolucanica intricata TaxID=1285191 RepID=UPI000834A068|nr:energy-coupling factor ABC transporter permease [Desulfolucanica intricata]